MSDLADLSGQLDERALGRRNLVNIAAELARRSLTGLTG